MRLTIVSGREWTRSKLTDMGVPIRSGRWATVVQRGAADEETTTAADEEETESVRSGRTLGRESTTDTEDAPAKQPAATAHSSAPPLCAQCRHGAQQTSPAVHWLCLKAARRAGRASAGAGGKGRDSSWLGRRVMHFVRGAAQGECRVQHVRQADRLQVLHWARVYRLRTSQQQSKSDNAPAKLQGCNCIVLTKTKETR